MAGLPLSVADFSDSGTFDYVGFWLVLLGFDGYKNVYSFSQNELSSGNSKFEINIEASSLLITIVSKYMIVGHVDIIFSS